MPVSIKH